MKAAAAAGARLWVDAEKVSMALVAAAEAGAYTRPLLSSTLAFFVPCAGVLCWL
jgi:hypothetical protein